MREGIVSRCGNQSGTTGNRSQSPAAVPAVPLPLGREVNQSAGTGNCSNGRKLTDEQVIAIRYAVGSGRLTQRAAAKRYGVHHTTISAILLGKNYQEPPQRPQPAAEPSRSYAAAAPTPAPAPPLEHPAIIAYRTEKARRQERDSRWAQQLAEAKADVARMDALRKVQQKGGRPKGRQTDQPPVFAPGKPKLNAVKIPAEDVLLYAVEKFQGLPR